jgi:polar amino acid transport system substrate-binding protein
MKLKSALIVAVAALGISTASAETFRVGTEPTGVPLSFMNVETNQLDGYMLDVVKEIGALEGFGYEFVGMEFSALIPALTTNKIDLIATGMYTTEARKQVISFTQPVYAFGEGLIVKKSDENDYKTLSDFPKGSTAGTVAGTVFIDQIKESGSFDEPNIYETIANVMQEVNNGRIQAGLGDYPIFAYYIQQGRFPNLRLVESYQPIVVGQIGIGLRKDDPALLDRLNKAIDTLQSNGKIDELKSKWGL